MTHLDKAKNQMDEVYIFPWGHCREELLAEVKMLDYYEAKYKERNVIWLLDTLQVTTYGIDSKADVILIEQEVLFIFIIMR